MKLIHLFIISLTCNVALGILYYLKPEPLAATSASRVSIAADSSPPVRLVEKPLTNVVPATSAAKPFDWRRVESEDYQQYVANLRAIGCPEKTLRDIIMADVTDLFRQRARNSASNRFEYWRPGVLGNAFDEKRVAQQQEQARQRREILAGLLGESYADKDDPAGGQILSPMEQMTGDFLTPEKQVALKAIEVKYASRMLQAAKDGGGENSEAMRKVMADKDSEMLTLLSPEEKFEYDLRLSQPAILLRMNLEGFEPTEEEFRQMFLTAKNYSDKFGLGVILRMRNPQPTDGAAHEMLDAFKGALGEERFAQFRR